MKFIKEWIRKVVKREVEEVFKTIVFPAISNSDLEEAKSRVGTVWEMSLPPRNEIPKIISAEMAQLAKNIEMFPEKWKLNDPSAVTKIFSRKIDKQTLSIVYFLKNCGTPYIQWDGVMLLDPHEVDFLKPILDKFIEKVKEKQAKLTEQAVKNQKDAAFFTFCAENSCKKVKTV